MAAIQIIDLCSVGVELFSDHESYLNDLSEDELLIQGGDSFVVTVGIQCGLLSFIASRAVGNQIGRAIYHIVN